jgi:hypothetical protein
MLLKNRQLFDKALAFLKLLPRGSPPHASMGGTDKREQRNLHLRRGTKAKL